MRKPEPWPLTKLRPRGALPCPGMPSGMPKRRKNCSIGEPLGNGSSRSDESCGPASDLTRTEITAGFTFSTMSAKPIGCARLLASCDRFCASAAGVLNVTPGATKYAPALSPAMVVARRARRRAERPPFWLRLAIMFSLSPSSDGIAVGHPSALGRRRWEVPPYRRVAAGLNFGNVANSIFISFRSIA